MVCGAIRYVKHVCMYVPLLRLYSGIITQTTKDRCSHRHLVRTHSCHWTLNITLCDEKCTYVWHEFSAWSIVFIQDI